MSYQWERVNRLHKKYSQCGGGGIPFSAMRKKSRKKKRSTKKSRRLRRKKKPPSEKRKRKHRKTKQIKTKTKTCECGSNTYTGQEETPRGLGKCEECIPLNVMIKGKDGNLYENKKEGWVKV